MLIMVGRQLLLSLSSNAFKISYSLKHNKKGLSNHYQTSSKPQPANKIYFSNTNNRSQHPP